MLSRTNPGEPEMNGSASSRAASNAASWPGMTGSTACSRIMTPIQHDAAVIRARLAADRARALAQRAAVSADIASLIAAADGSNSDDEHDPEGATIAFERAQLQALERAARAQVDQLDAA